MDLEEGKKLVIWRYVEKKYAHIKKKWYKKREFNTNGTALETDTIFRDNKKFEQYCDCGCLEIFEEGESGCLHTNIVFYTNFLIKNAAHLRLYTVIGIILD